jgi:cyclase
MAFARVIPCLLLKGRGLYKTVKFRDPRYVGDPTNAVKIFNEKGVDELVLLDIAASVSNRGPDFDLIREIASEAFIPLCYGGGVRSVEQFAALFRLGVEKVAVNTGLVEVPDLVFEASRRFGGQSVIASIDVRRTLLGRHRVCIRSGTRATELDPVTMARQAEAAGAGEIILNAIDRDGTMQGMDIALIRAVADAVSVPVVAIGGAGNLDHIAEAIGEGGASAVAAGSMFVFTGRHRAVLITYPSEDELARVNARATS